MDAGLIAVLVPSIITLIVALIGVYASRRWGLPGLGRAIESEQATLIDVQAKRIDVLEEQVSELQDCKKELRDIREQLRNANEDIAALSRQLRGAQSVRRSSSRPRS